MPFRNHLPTAHPLSACSGSGKASLTGDISQGDTFNAASLGNNTSLIRQRPYTSIQATFRYISARLTSKAGKELLSNSFFPSGFS